MRNQVLSEPWHVECRLLTRWVTGIGLGICPSRVVCSHCDLIVAARLTVACGPGIRVKTPIATGEQNRR